MTLLLENLPDEIILHIFKYIDPKDIDTTQTRLLKCNKALHRRFEPWLYSSQESRDRIMRLACIRGLNETIKLAVGTYNASPSTVTVWQKNSRNKMDGPLKMLTLHLATKKRKPDTFALLLKLGARVDAEGISSVVATSQIFRILKALPIDHEKMLRPFLTSGAAGQVQHLSVADHCLAPAIAKGASVETVQLLLDHGANPDRLHTGDIRMNALSAAVKVGAIHVFMLLLDRGADLNVKGTLSQARSILEVPVFAAAQAMAESQSTEMLQLCIDHGASLDVNIWFQHQNSLSFMTVLLAYLDAIDDWRANFRLSPVQGVSFILYHLRQHQSDSGFTKEAKPGLDRLLTGQILDILVRKWGVDCLKVDEFSNVIKLLAVESTKLPHNTLIYLLYMSVSSPLTPSTSERWLEVLDILFRGRDHTEMGKLLYQLISFFEDAKYIINRRNAGMLVDQLIQSGADINFSPHEGPFAYPVLHTICEKIDKDTRSMEEGDLMCLGWKYEIDMRSWLLEMIVRKGGDATLQFNGLNAFDLLQRTRHNHVDTRVYISHLTGYLRYPGGVMDDLEDFVEFSRLFSNN